MVVGIVAGQGVAERSTSRCTLIGRVDDLTFTGEDSPIQELLKNVVGWVAMVERALIKERQMEGIALAKARGVHKGRKKGFAQYRPKNRRWIFGPYCLDPDGAVHSVGVTASV